MSSPSRRVIDPLICSYSDSSEAKAKPAGPLPPPSKLVPHQAPGPSAPSSWTPLGSHTFSNDIMSHSSTPSSKIFSTLFKQSATGSGPSPQDYDFPGLNLTPFLNLINNPGGTASANFTPLYDKSIHMADFFMDSPIRQSTGKVDTITPSRFALTAQQKPSGLSSKKATLHSSKRSITSLDTPARHPMKKLDKEADLESSSAESDEEDIADSLSNRFEEHFVTPSKKKVLNEVSNNSLNKTPMKPAVLEKSKFHTPATTHQVSSPSTVIVSSAVKSPSTDARGNPPSPTPNKESKESKEGREPTNEAGPVMGVFNEKRAPPKMADPAVAAKKPSKKSQGLNRFQIVFTDVHTLMNGKKKKGDKERKLERKAKAPPLDQQGHLPHSQGSFQSQPLSGSSFSSYNTSLPTSQDFNSSINTSKEFSLSNSSITSHSNMTSADHASFDMMHGGLISTPNGKFLLDNSFDNRNSPTGRKPEPKMLPPKTLSLQQAASNAAQRLSQHGSHEAGPPMPVKGHEMPMSMVMSTPQHGNIRNPMGILPDEASPSNKEAMAFLYQTLHYQDSPETNHVYGARSKSHKEQ